MYGEPIKANTGTLDELKAMYESLTDPEKRAEVVRQIKRAQRITMKRKDTGL